MSKAGKTSPLRADPGTLPGSSIRGTMVEKLAPAVVFIFVLGIAAGIGIGSIIAGIVGPFNIWVVAIAFGAEIAILIAMYRYVRRAGSEIDNLKLGASGEAIVAEQLQRLIADGYHILHDIPYDNRKEKGSNIDHIAVGPGGVFVIETKTRSKGTEYEVHVDDEQLTLGGEPFCDGAIGQTLGNARRIGEILDKVTGRSICAQPVLVLAGRWYVRDHRSEDMKQRCWVHNDVTFLPWIRNAKLTLSNEDVHLYTTRLREYAKP